jgi:hypothetical protein
MITYNKNVLLLALFLFTSLSDFPISKHRTDRSKYSISFKSSGFFPSSILNFTVESLRLPT